MIFDSSDKYAGRQRYYGWSDIPGPYYKARVYHYDETGNRERTDYLSEEVFDSKSEAIDHAHDWCEEHGFEDAEMG